MMTASVLDSSNPTFDRVDVTVDGELRAYSYEEFMKLELAVRIRLILAGTPTFWSGETKVDKRTALSLGR